MTATERLRQLLDERGVEWARGRYDRREFTRWYIRNNSGYIAASFRDVLADGNGKPFLRCEFYEITPEQAVEATLGRGTCKLEQHGSLADQPSMVCWSCSVCGFGWHHSINGKQFSYCPNCGRRVEP